MHPALHMITDPLNLRLSIGVKIALLLVIMGFAAGGVLAWRIYETQSAQINHDFEGRALLAAHAVEASTASHVTPQTDAERLRQIIEQQNHIEALIAREPALLLINVYARHQGELIIINSSDRGIIGAPPAREDAADLPGVFAGESLAEEQLVFGENAYELIGPLEIEGQPPLAIAVYLSTADRDEALVAVQRTFGQTLLAVIVTCVAILYGVVWVLVPRRLQRLARAADRMRRGDYAARVGGVMAPDARDEISRLMFDFNTMAQAIEGLHAQTSSLASTDPLTGLYNRRFFLESLQREMERSRREGAPMATVMLDLDGFKMVNDRYGHTVGDAALMHIAHALRTTARAGDLTARFGGDEFVALLPNCDTASLEGVMERIRRNIAELAPPRSGDGEALHITVSAGGAQLREDDTVDSLMGRADLALFEAKNNGRNQVRLAA
jgi:diguanylate cyclase (GGDEF)-like protein